MGNRYDRERSRQQDEDREAFRREYGRRNYGQSSRGGYRPSEGGEQYFGGSMQYGEGYTAGGRDYEREHRSYEGGSSDSSQPGFGYRGNSGGQYDSGTYRRSGGYAQGFGSEASRRHSGVGYSGRSGYGGDDWQNRSGSRFAGQGSDDFTDYGQNYPGSERRYGGRERGWWDRTSDEVASWFGDEEAARRRQNDDGREGQFRGRGPSNYMRSDERIKEDVNDRLTDHPYIDASNINVEATSGEVMLSGTVNSRQEKRLAEDIAERVSGVRNVENRVRVNNMHSAMESDRSSEPGMSAELATPSSKAASRG